MSSVKYIILIWALINPGYGFVLAQNSDTVKYKTKEINVFSNKIITNKFDSPVVVQYINKREIENKNGQSLSDALQLGGGVFMKSYGGNGSLSTISLNGLGAEHTLVLLNGFKINSSQNNLIDLNTVVKENIESIEILNNGSSSLYGSEAMGGVVNIITKDNLVKDLKLRMTGQIGSNQQNYLSAGIEKNFNKFNIDLSFSKEASQNDYEYYYNNGTNKVLKNRDNSDYELQNYSAALNYLIDQFSSLNLYSNLSNQSRNIPGLETGSVPSDAIQLDRNWNSILTYENILSHNVSFKSQFNFQNNLSNYADNILINSYYKNIFLSNLTQFNFIKNNYEATAGYEIDYSTLYSNETEYNIDRIQPAVFFVSKINLNEMLKIYPSVRYDYISDIKKSVLSGKLGVNVKPISNSQLNFKSSIGNNFAAPTFNELYWKDLGNKNLLPESSVNLDAGVIYGFNFISNNSIEINYTFIDASNKIVWSPNSNGQWTPKNIGMSSSNAVLIIANIEKDISNNFSSKLNVSYSFTNSIKKSNDYENDPTFGKQIFYIPQELGKCNFTLNYMQSGINMFYTFTGKRYTNFENTNYLKAVDLFEGNVFQNFKINKLNLQLRFEVNNIFNADYQIISGYPMPLRNYRMCLGIEY